jgi:hypothetical protein
MKSFDEAYDEFYAAVIPSLPQIQDTDNYDEILRSALTTVWEHSRDRAVFEHSMALFALDIVRGINKGVGHREVARRLDITVEELVRRINNFADLTMSEIRHLANAAELLISYDVIGTKTDNQEK